MPRARAAVILATGLSIVALGSLYDGAGAEPLAAPPTTVAAAPPTSPPVVASSVPAAPGTSSATITGVRRGGVTAGSVAKPADEQWDIRRMIVTTALGVLALSVLGYGYGRIRSTPPRHPDLVRSPD